MHSRLFWKKEQTISSGSSSSTPRRSLQKAGMTADFSWGPSAKQYLEVYQKALG